MGSKKLLSLCSPDGTDDPDGLFNAQRTQPPSPPEVPVAGPDDTETFCDPLYLRAGSPEVASEVPGVDAWRSLPIVHNTLWVAGKVPSLNELLDAKSRGQPKLRSIIMKQKPVKGNAGNRYSLYNDIKQEWKRKTIRALPDGSKPVQQAYFGYVIVEETVKRDPSNICSAAIKFIEDGLVEAKVMPNDGWRNVLGIRMVCIHRPGRDPGIFVVMSDQRLDEDELVRRYEEDSVQRLFQQ